MLHGGRVPWRFRVHGRRARIGRLLRDLGARRIKLRRRVTRIVRLRPLGAQAIHAWRALRWGTRNTRLRRSHLTRDRTFHCLHHLEAPQA